MSIKRKCKRAISVAKVEICDTCHRKMELIYRGHDIVMWHCDACAYSRIIADGAAGKLEADKLLALAQKLRRTRTQ